MCVCLRARSAAPCLSSHSSFQIFDDGDLPPVGVIRAEAVQVEAAVPGQGPGDGAEGQSHVGVRLSVLVQVGRQRPLARGHLLVDGRVDAQLRRQLALDGRRALELVVDVDAEPPPGLLELRRHVGRPLGRVGPKLPHLQRGAEGWCLQVIKHSLLLLQQPSNTPSSASDS